MSILYTVHLGTATLLGPVPSEQIELARTLLRTLYASSLLTDPRQLRVHIQGEERSRTVTNSSLHALLWSMLSTWPESLVQGKGCAAGTEGVSIPSDWVCIPQARAAYEQRPTKVHFFCPVHADPHAFLPMVIPCRMGIWTWK